MTAVPTLPTPAELRELANRLDKIYESGTYASCIDEGATALRQFATLIEALNEQPSSNWLARLKDGESTEIAELYQMFQQRVLGRAKHLALTKDKP